MSTRALETPAGAAAFDYGAQYMMVREPAFRARMAAWAAAGLVARWPAAGDDAWVGTPGMSAPVADMAHRLDVRWSSHVTALVREEGGWRLLGEGGAEGPFDAVVVAVPAEQVAPLVAHLAPDMAAASEAVPSRPCWTLVACYAAALSVEADILKGEGTVGWAARDSAKPDRGGPETWVIQAGPDWSAAHLEETCGAVTADLLAAFAAIAGTALPEPVATYAHRWRYARSGRGDAPCHWNGVLRLGVCGDWCIGPRVEAAWRSGTALAAAVGGSAR